MSSSAPQSLTFEHLQSILSSPASAIRIRTRLQPAGGQGDKVFPPTYTGGVYACEDRRINGEVVKTVLLDSVQSQANRFELALLAAYSEGILSLPLMKIDFSDTLPDIGQLTSLETPHRTADAIIRDSVLGGKPFPDSEIGQRITNANVRNATPLFKYCPTALIFGTWDSTGARGGLGNKFARCIASEIVAFDVQIGVRTSSRIDPLGIEKVNIYESKLGDWTALEAEAKLDEKGNPIRYKRSRTHKGFPSEINHGNVTPDLVRAREEVRTTNKRFVIIEQDGETPGGTTMAYALQTTVLSLPALRRLRFPDESGKREPSRDKAAHATLAALTLAAIAYQRMQGYDLRSRCLLVPEEEPAFEVVTTAKQIEHFTLSPEQSAEILVGSVEAAKKAGMAWVEDAVVLKPKPALVELVKQSRQTTLGMEE